MIFSSQRKMTIELAIIESWRMAVDTGWKDRGFMIWDGEMAKSEAARADSLRNTIGLRSIELNNKLIDMEKRLTMNFYLSPFHGGIVTVKD